MPLGIIHVPIRPYNPIYMAGYIQDKFAFKDLIFNMGYVSTVLTPINLYLRTLTCLISRRVV